VREADSYLVWSFTGPTPASFWIRRMAHETLVHQADAQLAAGARAFPRECAAQPQLDVPPAAFAASLLPVRGRRIAGTANAPALLAERNDDGASTLALRDAA
jgi:hypothetical protein